MTERIMTIAAALMLAATLAACGASDNKKPDTPDPDNTPNGSITTQPDTNGTDSDRIPGDSMNGGHNADGGAAPGDGPQSAGGDSGAGAARRYDRALAASLSQLLVNRLTGAS